MNIHTKFQGNIANGSVYSCFKPIWTTAAYIFAVKSTDSVDV